LRSKGKLERKGSEGQRRERWGIAKGRQVAISISLLLTFLAVSWGGEKEAWGREVDESERKRREIFLSTDAATEHYVYIR